MSWSYDDIPSQAGRVAVVTGANGGLGLATAAALARRGAHVVMAARNQVKARAAQQQILDATPEASLEIVALDLSSQASVKTAAADVLGRHARIDLLVNNAGVMATPEGRTVDGYETQLGTNHLGHWTWTALLLPAVLTAPAGRVVTLTSVAQHQGRNLDRADDGRDAVQLVLTRHGQAAAAGAEDAAQVTSASRSPCDSVTGAEGSADATTNRDGGSRPTPRRSARRGTGGGSRPARSSSRSRRSRSPSATCSCCASRSLQARSTLGAQVAR